MTDALWFFASLALFCALGISARYRYGSWQHTALVSFTFGSYCAIFVRLDYGLVAGIATQVIVATAVMVSMMWGDTLVAHFRK